MTRQAQPTDRPGSGSDVGRSRSWVAFSDSDPITGGMAPILRRHVPGASGLDHPTIAVAGHFLQEDAGEPLGEVVVAFVRRAA